MYVGRNAQAMAGILMRVARLEIITQMRAGESDAIRTPWRRRVSSPIVMKHARLISILAHGHATSSSTMGHLQ